MSVPFDSRQLRAFLILARTGSFTQTARELHLTQSAISHAIKGLEADARCRLLDRVGKTVTLTQAGEQLLASTEKIMNEMASAREQLEHLGKWGRSRLRIGASLTACQFILPAVLREFQQSFPQCSIHIEPGDLPQVLESLHSRRIDLALALEPERGEPFEFRPLFSDELQFVTSPLHPWALTGKVDRSSITKQNYILYNKNTHTFRQTTSYFREEGIELPSFIELGSMQAIKELVKIGLGISILAPWIARSEIREKSLVVLPLGRRKLRRNWGILHWQGRRLSLAEETFIGLCCSVAEGL
jgi:DNA-binding transcriptional LysR family regulator